MYICSSSHSAWWVRRAGSPSRCLSPPPLVSGSNEALRGASSLVKVAAATKHSAEPAGISPPLLLARGPKVPTEAISVRKCFYSKVGESSVAQCIHI